MRGHATIDNKYIKYGMLDNIIIVVVVVISADLLVIRLRRRTRRDFQPPLLGHRRLVPFPHAGDIGRLEGLQPANVLGCVRQRWPTSDGEGRVLLAEFNGALGVGAPLTVADFLVELEYFFTSQMRRMAARWIWLDKESIHTESRRRSAPPKHPHARTHTHTHPP